MSSGAAARVHIVAKALAASVPAKVSQQASSSARSNALAGRVRRSICFTSQIKAVVSALAEATILPLGEKATAFTCPVWPLKTASFCPV